MVGKFAVRHYSEEGRKTAYIRKPLDFKLCFWCSLIYFFNFSFTLDSMPCTLLPLI